MQKKSVISTMLASTLLLGVSTLSGCATISKEECISGNWQSIGFADGAAGRTPERLQSYSKQCAKVGVAPDHKSWEKGRQEGLKKYCTETNAYKMGRQGNTLNAVCPVSITARLERINLAGREHYSLNKKLQEKEKSLAKYQEEYTKLVAGDNLEFKTDTEARTYLVGLPQKIRMTKNDIEAMQYDISKIERKYGF